MVHMEQIRRYGGSFGLRDQRLLESALAQPEATFGGEFLHDGLFEMGAAYLFHLVQNHPFVDGNKRVGLECALLFLELNGATIEDDPDALADMVLEVATGRLDKAAIASYLSARASA